MSARRLRLAVLAAAACGEPATPPTPAPIAPPPDPAPVLAVTPPAPEPPPTPPTPEPATEDPPAAHGVRRWHLAAVREGAIALHPLVDGSLAVRGDIAFAIAPPRTGPLRRERAWTRGLAFDELERSATSIALFGGRWPDLAVLTIESESSRIAALHSALRWQDSAWMPDPLPPQPGLVPYYAAVAGAPDGPIAGLRSHAVDDSDETYHAEDDPPRAPPRVARSVLDRLTPDGRASGPWPALPAGTVGTDLLALPGGDLVVARGGPELLHWVAGSKAWKKLPPVGYKASGYHDRPLLAGRDPTRLYLAACLDGADDFTPQLHRFDGVSWHRLTPPNDRCVLSLAESDDGAVWVVADGALYRDDPGEPQRWDPVRLPRVTLPAREPAWRPGRDGEPWREFPDEPASEHGLTPLRVLALPGDDLWLVAAADRGRFAERDQRTVVLATRPVKQVLQLPDGDLADLEAHAQEPEVVPTSRENACHNIVLDLGETTDVPATERPPGLRALADDETDLRRLSVVAVDLGGRHGVQALWLADSPDPQDSYALLGGLAERLRDGHPRVRLLCRTPVITRVLP